MQSLISVSLAGIAKAICDTLQFHYNKSVFPLGSYFWNPTQSWKNKYKDFIPEHGPKFFGSTTFLVFCTDGWHLFQMIAHVLLIAAIVIYKPITPIKIEWLSVLVDFVILKVAHQSVFHIFYTWIFFKGKK